VSQGQTLEYDSDVIIERAGRFELDGSSLDLRVDGDLILRAGSTRIVADETDLSGKITVSVTGEVTLEDSVTDLVSANDFEMHSNQNLQLQGKLK